MLDLPSFEMQNPTPSPAAQPLLAQVPAQKPEAPPGASPPGASPLGASRLRAPPLEPSLRCRSLSSPKCSLPPRSAQVLPAESKRYINPPCFVELIGRIWRKS